MLPLLRPLATACAAALIILFDHIPASACSICRGGDQTFFVNNARLLPAGKWVLAIDNLFIERKKLYAHPATHLHGDIVRLNLAAQRRLISGFDAIIELNTRNAESDRQSAAVIPHSGGKIIYLSPGLRIKMGNGLSFRGQMQTPVVKKLNGIQDEKANFRGSFVLSL